MQWRSEKETVCATDMSGDGKQQRAVLIQGDLPSQFAWERPGLAFAPSINHLCPLHSLERLALFQQTVMVRQVPRKLGIWWYHVPLALATSPSYQTPPPRPPPAAPFLSLSVPLFSVLTAQAGMPAVSLLPPHIHFRCSLYLEYSSPPPHNNQLLRYPPRSYLNPF